MTRLAKATSLALAMITGAHFLLYSQDPEADRTFFRDTLGFPFVDIGHGWQIFALPPSEIAVHPGDSAERPAEHEVLGTALYLMCDDLKSVLATLAAKGVQHTEIEQAEWGIKTTVRLPSGGAIGLYQPRHPTALGLRR